jgi:hypothetical protein
MSKNMDALVAGVRTNKSESKAKDYARASEWPKCSHTGCPLQTTIKAETVTCSYHYREHGHNAECITEAVKEFAPYLRKYGEMIFWDVRQWKEKRSQMMGWPVLPATKEEMDWPNKYLTRLKVWIDAGVKKKAEEYYTNGI